MVYYPPSRQIAPVCEGPNRLGKTDLVDQAQDCKTADGGADQARVDSGRQRVTVADGVRCAGAAVQQQLKEGALHSPHQRRACKVQQGQRRVAAAFAVRKSGGG